MSQHKDPPPPPSNSTDGWRVLSYLIGGIVVYGGVGWLLDRWLDTSFFLPAGIVLGAGLTILLLQFRYGRSRPPPGLKLLTAMPTAAVPPAGPLKRPPATRRTT